MKGRTAIITGASSGIGRAAAVKLASMGADIVINYLGNSQAAEETEKLCIKAGASVLKIKGDVACFDDCMRIVSRQMLKQRYGKIINMASVVGIMGNAGQANYAASKAGVIGMTRSFAREVASKGITVNAVAPGFIATDMTEAMTEEAYSSVKKNIPMDRIGTPEEVAEIIAFLAGPQSGYVTGQVICVDGGMCMS